MRAKKLSTVETPTSQYKIFLEKTCASRFIQMNHILEWHSGPGGGQRRCFRFKIVAQKDNKISKTYAIFIYFLVRIWEIRWTTEYT